MNDIERQHAEKEVLKGEEYQRVWDSIICPFFDAKQKELYDVFVDTSSLNKKSLLAIKHQSNALSSLKDEFLTHINPGKLAREQLKGE